MGQSVLKNLLAKSTLSVFNILIPFLILPYVYRVLGPEKVGDVEYGTTLYTYFGLLGLLGIYNYGLREISINRNDREKVGVICSNLFYIGFISNILFFVLYEIFVLIFIKEPNIRYIMYILGFNLIAQIFYIEWMHEAFEDFRFITIKTVIIRLISVVFIVLLVRGAADYLVYVLIIVGTLFLNNIVSFIKAQNRIGRNIISSVKKIDVRVYVIPLLLILVLNNTNVLYTMADRTMLGIYSEAKDVAYYSLGQKVAEAIKVLLLSIVFVTLPRLSSYLETNKDLYISSVRKLIRLMLLLVLPVSIGMFMLSEQIVLLFAGEQYLSAVPCFKVFSLRIIILAVEAILYNQVFFLHRKERILLVMNLFCGVLNVILNFVFLKHFTPFIAITTTVLCEILFQCFCLIYVKKALHLSLHIFKKENLLYLGLSLIFIPVIWILSYFVNVSGFMLVLLSVVCCTIIYIGGLYWKKDELFLETMKRIL